MNTTTRRQQPRLPYLRCSILRCGVVCRAVAEQAPIEERFALEKTRGVERFLEAQQLVIKVMADLVGEGAQEGAELDHLAALGGVHPYRDARRVAVFTRLVEAVQFAALIAGAALADFDREWRRAKRRP